MMSLFSPLHYSFFQTLMCSEAANTCGRVFHRLLDCDYDTLKGNLEEELTQGEQRQCGQ